METLKPSSLTDAFSHISTRWLPGSTTCDNCQTHETISKAETQLPRTGLLIARSLVDHAR